MAHPTPDTSHVADAINRVLDAERATAAAIAAAQVSAEARLEAARDRRRQILERARERVVRLHERAQAQLETRLAEMDRGAAMLPPGDPDLAHLSAEAVARLACRLTGGTAK